ncbi:MAG: peptide/nickel transport system substrate-binding protein [Candidatus Eremiobacteraeota bacterium]|nr:peptide/nickel transport system substrate-binding protein [Candidatus Eremiobacteraeota bacterium]
MRPAVRSRLIGIAFAAGFVCAGCSRAASDGGSGSNGVPGAAVVRFALAADPQSLDPLFAHVDANSVEQQVARLAFEPFIDVDEHGAPVPVLLDRVPTVENGGVSRDGRSITYHLRRGVRWEDGVAVTAHDVVWTLHAILDDRNAVRSRAGYDRVAKAEALDDRTVRVTLKEPWAPAVATLFSYGTAPQYVLPSHLLEKEARLEQSAFSSHPVGNGPYRLVSWARGDHLVYEASASYWRGAPKVARLDIRIVPDPGSNFTQLQSGAVDWNLLSPAQRESLGMPAALAFRTVPLALIAGIAINTTHPPLDDVRVRRALAASIDRESIARKITFGRYPVVDTAQSLGSWARDPSVREPAYDPATADRLFDAAGWKRGADGIRAKDGKQLALTYVQFPESATGVRVATVVQSELGARGLKIAIKSLSNVQLFLPKSQGGALANGAFDLAYVPWAMGADPDDSFLLGCGGYANYMRWCDKRVDALERRAVTAPSRAERKRLYSQIERRVADAVPVVYLFNPSYSYAYRTALHGFYPNGFDPTWDAYRWSLAAP